MNTKQRISIEVCSEIGKLEGVIIHTPGHEVEEMTPENAKRALYSDILNLSVAAKEYEVFKRVLDRFTQTYEVSDLLSDVLKKDQIKLKLLKEISTSEDAEDIFPMLAGKEAKELSRTLIQGVLLERNNLTRYLSQERFSLRPLHNFLFTRDASMSVYNNVLIGKMANKVRDREALIMNAIFENHPLLQTTVINPNKLGTMNRFPHISIEGGDVLVAREDVLILGTGMRTTTDGIDFILEAIKQKKDKAYHILIQELPKEPESFIHLDMVFTFLDVNSCLIYEPLITGTSRYRTIQIDIEKGKVRKIREEDNLLKALKKLNFDLQPIPCGGGLDSWTQDREQWHSGANFFAIAPGVVMGYERNVHTIQELHRNGFEIIKGQELINPDFSLPKGKCVITIPGSELARGGGGARCMTMPLRREKADW